MEDDDESNNNAAAAVAADQQQEPSGSAGDAAAAAPMVLDIGEQQEQQQPQVCSVSAARPPLRLPPPHNNIPAAAAAAGDPPALTIQVAACGAASAPPRVVGGGGGATASSNASHQSSLRMRAHSPVSMVSSTNAGQQQASGAAAVIPAATAAIINNSNHQNPYLSSSSARLSASSGAAGAAAAVFRSSAAETDASTIASSTTNSIRSLSHNNSHNNLSSVVAGRASGGSLLLNGPESDMEEDEAFFNDSSTHSPSGWSEVELSQDNNRHGHPNNNNGGTPSARSLHATALLNGNMLVFGGYDGHQRVNTFHAFSFAEKRWSPVLPHNAAPPPTPRDRAIACAWGNAFYVQGGFDGIARVDDFWAFDFSTMTWREVLPLQGRPPSPRHSHAAAVHDHSLWIFGGYDGSYKSDLYEFDFTTSRWSAIVAAGRRPRARYRATLSVHKNSLILFGGHDGTRHLADTHIFDIETRTWSSLTNIEGTPPTPRDSHVSVVHGNSMYIFGGSSGAAMNDLHELQLPPDPSMPARWRAIRAGSGNNGNNNNNNNNGNINATGNNNNNNAVVGAGGGGGGGHTDMPRRRFCHVAVVYQDSMFVFGGYDGSERLSDFIKFDFSVYDMSFEVPPSSIISDFRSMMNDKTLSDVTFIVEGEEIYAHKLMLIRCSYFQSLFLGSMMESRQSTISIEQVRHSIFLAVLEYLYTDQLRIPLSSAMELFEAADLFCIPRLKTMCEKRMLQSIAKENAASIFYAADMHSAATLRQKAKKYILTHFEEVSKTTSFEEMGRNNIELVFELLRSR